MRGNSFRARQNYNDACRHERTAKNRLEKWHRCMAILEEIQNAKTLEEAKAIAKVGLL